jgi:hypothetical protein
MLELYHNPSEVHFFCEKEPVLLSNQEVEEQLKDYTDPKGELASLTKFVTQALHLSHFEIVEKKGEQWSQETKFRVRDRENRKKHAFLKVFSSKSKNFIPEIMGLKLLASVEELSSLKVLSIGKYYVNSECYFVIAETSVPGSSMQSLYDVIGECCCRTARREKAINTAREGCLVFGKSLAQLHAVQRRQMKGLPQWCIATTQSYLDQAMKKLQHFPEYGIDVEKLRQYALSVLSRVEQEYHVVGIAHHDVKLAHVFYDPPTGQCSLVDPGGIAKSFAPNGELTGLPAKDFHGYCTSLTLNRFDYHVDWLGKTCKTELLTEEETEVMVEAFQKSYLAAGGTLPGDAELEFLTLRHNLWFIANCLGGFSKPQDEPYATRLNDLLALSLDELKSKL